MSAPTYVIAFLLVVAGVVGYVVQTPYLSIYPSGKFENGLEVTLAAENAPTLKFDYFSLAWHSDKEQANAMREEIIIHGNRENHQGWYAMVSGEENRPKLRILHNDGLSLSVNDWSGITDGSGSQPKGTLSFGKSPTALIPALFGLILIGCVVGSQRKEALRKHLMHLAALVGLLGTITPGIMAWSSYRALGEVKVLLGELATNPNTQPPSPVKFLSQGVTAALCFFFLILCIQSFVKARKQQPAPVKPIRPPLRDTEKPTSSENKEKSGKKTDSAKDKEDKEDKEWEKLRDRRKPPEAREKKAKRDSEKTKGDSSSKPKDSIPSNKKKLGPKPPPSSAKGTPAKPSFSKSITPAPPEKPPSTENKLKDKKSGLDKKSGPPKPADKKEVGPMPPPPAPKGAPGKPPSPPGKLPSPDKKPERDSKDATGKSGGPPKPSGKKDLGRMPPPPKESPSKPPPPPGSISPLGKSDSGETTPAPKKDAPDPKIGRFRLSGSKPIRINRPKDTESSPDKEEEDEADGED